SRSTCAASSARRATGSPRTRSVHSCRTAEPAVDVALFIPCYVDQLAPRVGLATVELLERLGCRVAFDPRPTCCRQPFVTPRARRGGAARAPSPRDLRRSRGGRVSLGELRGDRPPPLRRARRRRGRARARGAHVRAGRVPAQGAEQGRRGRALPAQGGAAREL